MTDKADQTDLGLGIEQADGPVECLGMMFESDQARREHFTEKLREKLKDPEFRKIEGFPIGEDEDILAMSDPPYYTACLNPWLGEFIREVEQASSLHSPSLHSPSPPSLTHDDTERVADRMPAPPHYHREPLAVDVSVGKTDALYRAHSYHTKVPHLAIVPSILHYTKPGDIVLDAFAGSGMTGVAAQWCGVAPADYRAQLESQWKAEGRDKPEWGVRRCILNDLSPAATFIAANYNLPFDVDAFAEAAKKLLKEVEDEIGWMYETYHVEQASSLSIDRIFHNAAQRGWKSPSLSNVDRRERDLPHWQYQGAILFVSFHTYGGVVLSDPARHAVLSAIKHHHGGKINLYSAVVMPDHAHMLFQLVEGDLSSLMHSIKSFSSNQVNRIMDRSGILWQNESYDRIVRDGKEFFNVSNYIWRNPEKAGLARKSEEYSWLWVSGEMKDAGWKPAPLGRIEYTVWSEVFTCPECAGEVVFLEEALDPETKRVKSEFPCLHCATTLTKRTVERRFVATPDPKLDGVWKPIGFRPFIIHHAVGKVRHDKVPDATDLAVLEKIAQMPLAAEVSSDRFPIARMYHGSRIAPKGRSWRRPGCGTRAAAVSGCRIGMLSFCCPNQISKPCVPRPPTRLGRVQLRQTETAPGERRSGSGPRAPTPPAP